MALELADDEQAFRLNRATSHKNSREILGQNVCYSYRNFLISISLDPTKTISEQSWPGNDYSKPQHR